MSKTEILIVGINSFLGRSICESLKDRYLITGVYHFNRENVSPGIEVVQVDLIESLIGRSFKHIYIISSYVPGRTVNDEKLLNANVVLPKKVCEIFPDARIIFCSSVSVYENEADSQNITLSSVPTPHSKYAISKLWGERIIEAHRSYGIIRISSMYGVGMKTVTFVPKIIQASISDQKINLLGSGQRMQNYVHVDDVADIAIKLAHITQNKTLLAVSDRSYTNREIAELILDLIPGQLDFYDTDDTKSYCYDNVDTRKLLGKTKFRNIKEGLEELVLWIKKTY